MRLRSRLYNVSVLLAITMSAILVQGYHPGAEDDGVYLAAIQRDLHPSLYAFDSRFFTLQLQATVFDRLIASFVQITHIPLAWSALLWQFAGIYLVLWSCWRISRLCFREECAQWAGVSLVAVLLTLPVAGTALYLVDQHLHPRTLATAAILAAVVAVIERRPRLAVSLLLLSAMLHPIMAAFGVSFCLCFAVAERVLAKTQSRIDLRGPMATAACVAAVPLQWIFDSPSAAWLQALNTRPYYHLYRWQWYEWLGAIAPIPILWWISKAGKRDGSPILERLALVAAGYATVQFVVALIILTPVGLVRLTPLQPMRYLHLVYFMMALLGGGLLGQKFCRAKPLRWVVLFLPIAAAMFYTQRQSYPSMEHLELPGRVSRNPWNEAFAWVREHTPEDAVFAIDPDYMALPGEDYHSFRALAERSVLADHIKDAAVVTQVAELGTEWQRQQDAQAGFRNFRLADFERLAKQYPVTWVVVTSPGVAGLDCPYRNQAVAVCKIPQFAATSSAASSHVRRVLAGN